MTKIQGAEKLKEGELKSFIVDGERIGVYRKSQDEFYTFDDECTHDGAPISDGKTESELIVCARHGAKFSMKDGSVQSMPATSPLDTYKNQFENGELYVDLNS